MALLFFSRQWIKDNPLAAVAIGLTSMLLVGYLIRSAISKS